MKKISLVILAIAAVLAIMFSTSAHAEKKVNNSADNEMFEMQVDYFKYTDDIYYNLNKKVTDIKGVRLDKNYCQINPKNPAIVNAILSVAGVERISFGNYFISVSKAKVFNEREVSREIEEVLLKQFVHGKQGYHTHYEGFPTHQKTAEK